MNTNFKTNLQTSILLICIVATLLFLTGCNSSSIDNTQNDYEQLSSNQLQVITTMFPTYDFAKTIIGEKGNVKLLIQPGQEIHSYEPSPKDIIKINQCDLFIYSGSIAEPWVSTLLEGLDNKSLKVLDCSKNIELLKLHDSKLDSDFDETDKDYDKEIETHESLKNNDMDHHSHEYDTHYWTDPYNCIIMINNILGEIIKLDPTNSDYYTANANQLINDFKELDLEIKDIIASSNKKELIFGSRFALLYFTTRYNLTYDAAYESCSSETEPSAKKIAQLIDKIKLNNIKVIFYEELTQPKIAQTLAESTGAKILLFHSFHNVTKDDFDNNITVLDLLKQNIENLKEGLK